MVSLNINDAINFSNDAWNSVTQQTINNCWKHTGILPQNNEMDEIDEIEDYNNDQAFNDEMELQNLINQLPFCDLMDVEEFLHIDDCLKSNEGLTDDEIVSLIVKPNNNEPEEDPNDKPVVIISKKEALNNLDNLVVFFENLSDISINPSELSVLQKLRHQVLKSHINDSKQITLDNFFQIL
jgi:hypothetical protein